jgi:hypothetical protein
MAIIVEEGRKKTNILGIAAWLVFLVIIGAAIYYIFFAQPQLVVLPATGSLNAIAPIAQLSLNPQSVVEGQAFQSLHSTITLPVPQGPAGVGRPDPFVLP